MKTIIIYTLKIDILFGDFMAQSNADFNERWIKLTKREDEEIKLQRLLHRLIQQGKTAEAEAIMKEIQQRHSETFADVLKFYREGDIIRKQNLTLKQMAEMLRSQCEDLTRKLRAQQNPYKPQKRPKLY